MADYKKLVPKILLWEGGYANIPGDSGGPTCKGVTLKTFQSYYGKDKTIADLKAITDAQWGYIFKKGFWDKCLGDRIVSQSVAEILIDWCWMSGVSTPVRTMQSIVGAKVDGQFGPKTLDAVNRYDARLLFNKMMSAREDFYFRIVAKSPVKQKFLKGWLNRLRYYKFES